MLRKNLLRGTTGFSHGLTHIMIKREGNQRGGYETLHAIRQTL